MKLYGLAGISDRLSGDDGVAIIDEAVLRRNEMHSIKLLGQRLTARDFDRQITEVHVQIAVPNGFTVLGIPLTHPVV